MPPKPAGESELDSTPASSSAPLEGVEEGSHYTQHAVSFPTRESFSNTRIDVIPIDEAPAREKVASSSVDAFISTALQNGFVASVPYPPGKLDSMRPTIRRGYSIRDWQAKIELRKGRMPSEVPRKKISQSEVEKHCTPASLWVVIRGVVYDVTEFQHFHPSFHNVLLMSAGHDITALVEVAHSWIHTPSFLATYALGYLEGHPPSRANDTSQQ